MPSVATRIRTALWAFRHGLPHESKAAPFLWPTWIRGRPQWHLTDFNNYVDEGFDKNTLIYSAIMYKVRSGTSAPLRAYTGDPEKPELLPDRAPLAQLVARPNRHQSWVEFQGQNLVYLNIAGNVYVYLDRKLSEGLPDAMYSLRPDRVYIVPDRKQGLKGYAYVPEGMTVNDAIYLLPKDVIHIKLPNPSDRLEGMGYGLSPIAPLARSGDVDNAITDFLKVFFDKGAIIPGLLKFDVPLDEDVVQRIRDRWGEVYGGSTQWHQIGVLDRGGEYQKVALNFDEMGFEALDERNESRILGPFGVPPILIGSRIGLARSTYANYREARQAFWEDTFVPEIRLFETDYRYYLQDRDGRDFVAFDLSDVPALRRNVVELTDAWVKLVGSGVNKDAATEFLGLPFGELPDGQVVYMPMNLVPVGSVGGPLMLPASAPQGETGAGQSEAEGEAEEGEKAEAGRTARPFEGKGWSPNQKAALWKAFDDVAESWTERFERAARASFEKQRRHVLALVRESEKAALHRKATIDWHELEEAIRDYLMKLGADEWRDEFVPLLQGIIEDQGERWATNLGIQFNVRNLFAEQWFKDYVLQFAQDINKTTLDALGDMLRQAMGEGWSIPDMQKRLGSMFEQWMTGELTPEEFEWYEQRMPRHRTEMIARTETIRASNAGSTELFQQWGVEQHEWLATRDDRVRPEHLAADGQVVDMGMAFSVAGEKLMFPGDPAGSPGNTINCRCTTVPVIDGKLEAQEAPPEEA